jgi:competence protein ComEA
MSYLERYRLHIIGLLLILIGLGIYLIYQDKSSNSSIDKTAKELVIDISGAVKKPGVYNFSSDSRVIDAINRAGGFTKRADLEKIAQEINQASLLDDEQKIYIPLKKSEIDINSDSKVAAVSSNQGVININQASSSQLESLPGIGPVYAQRIVDYRNKIGRFNSAQQLLEISGIGPRTLEKIAPEISL